MGWASRRPPLTLGVLGLPGVGGGVGDGGGRGRGGRPDPAPSPGARRWSGLSWPSTVGASACSTAREGTGAESSRVGKGPVDLGPSHSPCPSTSFYRRGPRRSLERPDGAQCTEPVAGRREEGGERGRERRSCGREGASRSLLDPPRARNALP